MVEKTSFGPFASLQTERLVADLLGDDPTLRDKARKILCLHAELVPGIAPKLRNAEICNLAALLRSWSPNISKRAINMTIAAALHQRHADTDKQLSTFASSERREIMKRAAQIRLWMDGAKTKLNHRQIGNIIKGGSG